MQQLTGLDEMFLSLDTGRTTGHVAGIAFFDKPSEKRDEVKFLRERVGDIDRMSGNLGDMVTSMTRMQASMRASALAGSSSWQATTSAWKSPSALAGAAKTRAAKAAARRAFMGP